MYVCYLARTIETDIFTGGASYRCVSTYLCEPQTKVSFPGQSLGMRLEEYYTLVAALCVCFFFFRKKYLCVFSASMLTKILVGPASQLMKLLRMP